MSQLPEFEGISFKLVVDNSKRNYKLKKKLFTGVKNSAIVTPSNWLAGHVRKILLK